MNDLLLSLDNNPPVFNESSLFLLNITLAFIMFGVALGIKPQNFKNVILFPKAIITGLIAQIIFLPALTFLLVLLIGPTPGVALGMILVAACPGGNISNFITAHAKGNTELAFSMSAVSDSLAFIITPASFSIWATLYVKYMAVSGKMVVPIEIDPLHMFELIVVLLVIPLIVGMFVAQKFPLLTQKISKPIKTISLLIFLSYVLIAIFQNFGKFGGGTWVVIIIVIIHNSLALSIGNVGARIARLAFKDIKTVTLETGIHNSGLGLIIIFNFFINASNPLRDHFGGMAYVAAFWGLWHIISGLAIAQYWSKKGESVG